MPTIFRKRKVPPAKVRHPFWLPASSFYILAGTVGTAVFLLIWGILHDGEEPKPWIPAGVGTSVILVGSVFLREVVLRKARNRYLLTQRRLDSNLDKVGRKIQQTAPPTQKLTLQKNAELIRQIQKKSEAAKLFMRLSDTHFEVFEVCLEYLRLSEKELETVNLGSPRQAALRRGQEIVEKIGKFHLLTWAEIESRTFTEKAKSEQNVNRKIETAQKALNVLDTALKYYPTDNRLIESQKAVREFIASTRVGHWIEKAERAAFKGHFKRAISHYKDALFFLARENLKSDEVGRIAEEIRFEIEKLNENLLNHKAKQG
jgi:tetratricopeptide (TPR) repeat protein